VTIQQPPKQAQASILLLADDDHRLPALRTQLGMALPSASLFTSDIAMLAEGGIPEVDAAVVDAGVSSRSAIETLRVLRARGFAGAVVVVSGTPDEPALRNALNSLGAVSVPRASVDASPVGLACALAEAAAGNSVITEEVAHARRVFAAGQMALSLQHSINNPLAALLAEAQLLQLEELTPEQHGAVDRMVDLCRRVVALVRRLDGLAGSG
jgi:signal transduction histidine kinase